VNHLEEAVVSVLLDFGQIVTEIPDSLHTRSTYMGKYSLNIFPDENIVVVKMWNREIGRISHDRFEEIYSQVERWKN